MAKHETDNPNRTKNSRYGFSSHSSTPKWFVVFTSISLQQHISHSLSFHSQESPFTNHIKIAVNSNRNPCRFFLFRQFEISFPKYHKLNEHLHHTHIWVPFTKRSEIYWIHFRVVLKTLNTHMLTLFTFIHWYSMLSLSNSMHITYESQMRKKTQENTTRRDTHKNALIRSDKMCKMMGKNKTRFSNRICVHQRWFSIYCKTE